jgi:6-phosphogluconate dehydrogenase (decarboxylating)
MELGMAEPFSDKLLAALRSQFGGHAVKRAE